MGVIACKQTLQQTIKPTRPQSSAWLTLHRISSSSAVHTPPHLLSHHIKPDYPSSFSPFLSSSYQPKWPVLPTEPSTASTSVKPSFSPRNLLVRVTRTRLPSHCLCLSRRMAQATSPALNWSRSSIATLTSDLVSLSRS